MKGRAEIVNVVGETAGTLPVIDIKLEFGHLVVTFQAEGPFSFPTQGHVRLFGNDGMEVVNGIWNIEEPVEVAPRVFATVALPIQVLAKYPG